MQCAVQNILVICTSLKGPCHALQLHLQRSPYALQCLQSIVATTQQSRFHTETLDTYCEDVDLKQLTLTAGDKELLSDADLRLFSGVHYGLVGANGTGK